LAEALGLADAVVAGTVVDQRAVLHHGGGWTGPAIEYEVFVHHAWKDGNEQRLVVRRVSPCARTLDVGVAFLIFANRWNGRLVLSGCLPTQRLGAAGTIAPLGPPARTFTGAPPQVPRSLPLSRWIRAHVVAGIGVYAYTWTVRDCIPPPRDRIAFPSIAIVVAIAAFVRLARRRWRSGLSMVAMSALMLLGHVVWTGRAFLSSEWNAAFLQW
jgi:hypothetical protein